MLLQLLEAKLLRWLRHDLYRFSLHTVSLNIIQKVWFILVLYLNFIKSHNQPSIFRSMSEGQLETPNYTVQLVLLNVLMVVLTVIFTIYSSLADKKKKLKDAEKKQEFVMGKEASVEAAKIKKLRQGLKGTSSGSSGRSKRRETKQNPMDIELTEI